MKSCYTGADNEYSLPYLLYDGVNAAFSFRFCLAVAELALNR